MSPVCRPAAPSDYDRFVSLFGELATGDPVPEVGRWQETMMPGTLFFEEAGEVVAYAWATPLAEIGYVRHVVVHPDHRGRGYGRVVMEELAARFRAAGCTKWSLNVKPDNQPAIRLYRSVGMKERYFSTALTLEWEVVAKLPAPTRDVTARLLEPDEDTAVEAAFGLPRGTLAATRKYPDRVVLRLVDAGAPGESRVGVASFDPHFPGAFPFRVADPTFARAVFEGFRPHALPKFSHVGLVVEDDAALTRLLIEHGAKARLEIVHHEGAL